MALSEPLWRVKTRPCPFYQSGRCMFADSCNFLHNVSVTAIPEAISPKHVRSQREAGPSTTHILPSVVIDSPTSIRSPPRSPRTTSLLLALRDVIGDPDDQAEDQAPPLNSNSSQDPSNSWSESLPTLVNDSGFGQYSQFGATIMEEQDSFDEELDNSFEGNWTAISDYDDEDDNDANSQSVQEEVTQIDESHSGRIHFQSNEALSEDEPLEVAILPANQEDDQPYAEHPASSRQNRDSIATSTSGLLSPIQLSTINFGSFLQDAGGPSTRETNSFDSGYAENWKPPPLMLASPPRSPSISSTFDLLSSPFGSHSARIISSPLGAFMPRSPASSAMQEEIQPLDLGLDSPQQYYASSQFTSPLRGQVDGEVLEERNTGDQEHEEALASIDDLSEDEDYFEHDSYGHTSIWDAESGSTSVFVGSATRNPIREQVNDAIKRLSRTPSHFLASKEVDFCNDDPVANSSSPLEDDNSLDSIDPEGHGASLPQSSVTQTDGDDLNAPDPDDTAFLAYLRSPPASANENDTLNTLYDIYSGIAPAADVLSDSVRNAHLSPPRPEPASLSNDSTPSSSLREQVFTPPPPTRKRSGTITADSPTSLSSPMTSLDSVSMGRASPFSNAECNASASGSGSQSPHGQELEVSRKIPFGFRTSFSLGRATKSSLITSRNAGRVVPPSPLECNTEVPGSDVHLSDANPSPMSSAPKGFKPLRLSTLNSSPLSRSVFQSQMSITSVNSSHQSGNINRASMSSTSVSSTSSTSNNPLLSSARSSLIPLHLRNTLSTSENRSPSPLSLDFFKNLASRDEPQSAPATSWRNSASYYRPSSRLSEPCYEHDDEDDDDDDTTGHFRHDPYGETIHRPISVVPQTAPITRAPSSLQHHQPTYAIATPRPTLMFAIASDNVEQVREVLESGDAGPNDAVGPLSALEFTLTNDKLANKLEIVKTLLAYGADPTVAKNLEVSKPSNETDRGSQPEEEAPRPTRSLMDEMDPATRYYVERADAVHTRRTSALIHRSFFRPLARVRYELIGQDRALEQLFRVLSMHSRQLAVAPMVVMLCGPSGHGKSLLARKFGSLLDVPTHTVNMTTLRSTHDLWQSYSMSPYETPTTCTLAEFLINNEGKRCVVVLDASAETLEPHLHVLNSTMQEIEKTVDQKTLFSLLMPWELGRCAFEADSRHVDVGNVIWLGTSNIGHDLVFQHRDSRKDPEDLMSREEYVELMALLRPQVSEKLGASVLSRITTVLPFVPFTLEEKKAICSEALYSLGGEASRSLTPATIQLVINTALTDYIAVEGARSLYRAISNQLVDII